MSKVTLYVIAVSVLAVLAMAALFAISPTYDADLADAALCFAVLGFIAHVLAYRVGNGISGSSALLPFLTAAVLAPTWVGAAAVATAVLASRLWLKGPSLKTLFNVAQV